ncbi:MAG: hypothetical protein IT423_03465 [Pirellulaceae bacterium]|nr:hypothetical protein [Pirellulaceae bacterium]
MSWLALGHTPQMYRDDPIGFSGWLKVGYWLCISNLIVWPIGAVLGLSAAFVGERWATKNRTFQTAMPIIYSWQCGVVFVLLYEDPWGVMGWLMD